MSAGGWNPILVELVWFQVYALGVVSAFEQILESLEASERAEIFGAYISALDEDAAKYRSDAAELEKLAGELSGPDQITADAGGTALQVPSSVLVGHLPCMRLISDWQ